MQTRRQSMTETAVSVTIGYLVALASQSGIFPLFGIYATMTDNLLIGAWFTAISVIRGYAVRRFFNWMQK